MGDRKTINKYYPPDFNPAAIIKSRRPKDAPQVLPTVRLTSPFSMRCTTCGEYIAKNRKFNARKERTKESYLGVAVLLFHIRCPRCSGEIQFKTDPKNESYAIESGAVKNYESGVVKAFTEGEGGSGVGSGAMQREEVEEVDEHGNVTVVEILKPRTEETMEQRLIRLEKEEEEEKERQKKSDLSLDLKKGSNSGNDEEGGRDALKMLESQIEATRNEIETHQELEALYMRNKRLEQIQSGNAINTSNKSHTSNSEASATKNDQDDDIARAAFSAKKRITPSNAQHSLFAANSTTGPSDSTKPNNLVAKINKITKITKKSKIRRV